MRGREEIGSEMEEEDKEMGKWIDGEVETLIEQRRYGDREEQDEGVRVMVGNGKDKETEKGGHCETMKKNVGGRTGSEGKCVLSIEKNVGKIVLKAKQRGKRQRSYTQGSNEGSLPFPHNHKTAPFEFFNVFHLLSLEGSFRKAVPDLCDSIPYHLLKEQRFS